MRRLGVRWFSPSGLPWRGCAWGRARRRRRLLVPSCCPRSGGRRTDPGVWVDVHHPSLDELGASGPLFTRHPDCIARGIGPALGRLGYAGFMRLFGLRSVGGCCEIRRPREAGGRPHFQLIIGTSWRGIFLGDRATHWLVDRSFGTQSARERPGYLRRVGACREPANVFAVPLRRQRAGRVIFRDHLRRGLRGVTRPSARIRMGRWHGCSISMDPTLMALVTLVRNGRWRLL
jgi:hypothetical protein